MAKRYSPMENNVLLKPVDHLRPADIERREAAWIIGVLDVF